MVFTSLSDKVSQRLVTVSFSCRSKCFPEELLSLSSFLIQCLYSGLFLSKDSSWHLSLWMSFFSDNFFLFARTIWILILFPHLFEVLHRLTLSENIWAYILAHHPGCSCRKPDRLLSIAPCRAPFWPQASRSYSLHTATQPAVTHLHVLPRLSFSGMLIRILGRTTLCSISSRRTYVFWKDAHVFKVSAFWNEPVAPEVNTSVMFCALLPVWLVGGSAPGTAALPAGIYRE